MTTTRRQFVRVCDCGCGQPTSLYAQTDRRRGKIAGQPAAFIKSHSANTPVAPAPVRFFAKLDASGDCFEWTGALTTGGYGSFKAESGQVVYAHRWIWEHLVGPIPEGMVIDHLCRNPRCCNPDHLEVVSQRTNTLRGFAPTVVRSRSPICKRGHILAGDNLTHQMQYGRLRIRCRTCVRERSRLQRLRRKEAA